MQAVAVQILERVHGGIEKVAVRQLLGACLKWQAGKVGRRKTAIFRDQLLQGLAIEPGNIADSAASAHGLLQKTQPIDVFICIKTATRASPRGAYAFIPAFPHPDHVLGDAGPGGYHPDGVPGFALGVLLSHGQ